MIKASTLRPGLLVSLKTSIKGNVTYNKIDLEQDHLTPSGKMRAKWETTRTIADPTEHERAVVIRSKVRSLVRSVCAASEFGLLCPEAKGDKLEEAIAQARQLAAEFNETAGMTQIYVYLMTGRVAPDDVEAIKAISSEVRDLMDKMKNGLERLDVKAVRDAAAKAKGIGSMLSPASAERIKVAIDAARSAAKKIVKVGEQVAQEIDLQAIAKITESRTAFLDLDVAAEVAAPKVDNRNLDLAPVEGGKVERFRPAQIELDME